MNASNTSDTAIDSSERTIALIQQALDEAFDGLDAWFERAPEALAFKPADGGWNGREILEHVSLTNHFLMIVIRKGRDKALQRAARGMAIPEGESDLALLEPIGQRGAFVWARPEHMVPTSKPSLEEVRAQLRAQRAECLQILADLKGGLGRLHRVRMSVNDSGRLDMFQWLYFLAMHAKRHLQQLEAVALEQAR
jgi:hypothetical protein